MLEWAWTGWVVLCCVIDVTLVFVAIDAVRNTPILSRLRASEPSTWPRLSIIVPACNEASTIEAATKTILAQTYPNFELVLINDRSTDETGAIVSRLAKDDARIVPVHIEALPDGWLGKVHALHQGTKRATGEWILFTDADVHFGPGFLERVISIALDRKADHVTLIPRTTAPSVWLGAVIVAFGTILTLGLRPHRVNKPGSGAFIGIGAFNLVRREAFMRSEGFEWLRLEIGDDLGLGLVMQRAGASTFYALAGEEFSIEWYPSLGALAHGLEKNMYPVVCRFRLWTLPFHLFMPICLFALPLWAACQWDRPWLVALGLCAFASLISTGTLTGRKANHPWIGCLLSPLASVFHLYVLVRSTFACVSRGGITWRGTFYPTAMLRAGQRLKFSAGVLPKARA